MARTNGIAKVTPERRSGVIRIAVSYAWPEGKTARTDKKWAALRNLLQSVCSEAHKRAVKLDGKSDIRFSVSRLRASHGTLVLGALVERIRSADAYVADVAAEDGDSCNPNVMVEVGLAIASRHGENDTLFLLKPKELSSKPEKFPFPSNLQGVLWTEYLRKTDDLSLIDLPGFTAALRSRLLRAAIERGLLRPKGRIYVDE